MEFATLEEATTADASFYSFRFVQMLHDSFWGYVCVQDKASTKPKLSTGIGSRSLYGPIWVRNQILIHDMSHPSNSQLMAPGDSGNFFQKLRSAIAKALQVSIVDPELDIPGIALTDLVLEAIGLAASLSFSVAQLQQLLILLYQTHSDVSWSTCEQDVAEKVARNLNKRLTRLTSRQRFPALEKVIKTETIVEEKVDPAAVAAATTKQKDAKGKKGAPDPIQALPKIKTTTTVTHEVTEERESVVVDPFFSYGDVVEIMCFLRSSLLQHWRLYSAAATLPPRVEVQRIEVAVEDAPLFLPPLSEAVTLQDFQNANQRWALWMECEAMSRKMFDELFFQPVTAIFEGYSAETKAAIEADALARVEDEAQGMNREEFLHTIQVLKNRLTKGVMSDKEIGEIERRLEKLQQAVLKPDAGLPKPAAAPPAKK